MHSKFYPNMFQQFIAIIRGSSLPQKLLRQYLYCVCMYTGYDLYSGQIAWAAFEVNTAPWWWQWIAETCWGKIWNAFIRLLPWRIVWLFHNDSRLGDFLTLKKVKWAGNLCTYNTERLIKLGKEDPSFPNARTRILALAIRPFVVCVINIEPWRNLECNIMASQERVWWTVANVLVKLSSIEGGEISLA
jgi:hypothetical protein